MTRRRAVGALVGAGILASWRSTSTGFVSTLSGQPLQSIEVPDIQRASSKTRLGAFLSASHAPEHTSRSDLSASSSGALWWSLIGLTLAGASLGSQRREVQVAAGWRARGIRRFTWMYGGKGAPKTPEWLTKEIKPGDKTKGQREIPSWFTLQKWESMSAGNRARSMRWWLQNFDENGNDAFDKTAFYSIEKAVDILLAMNARAPSQFDVSIELIMQMNLDPKFPDQQIRTSASLPHGTGKDIRVAVFCRVDEEDEVMALGAHKCGKQLADEIAEEKIDFDVLIAKPQMMPQIAKLGRILGPRRLVPSPKSGTVVQDYEKAIEDFKKGMIELRNDRNSQVMCIAGKLSFGKQKLVENIKAIIDQMVEKRPAGAPKDFWTKMYIGATQSPSIRISPSEWPVVPEKAAA